MIVRRQPPRRRRLSPTRHRLSWITSTPLYLGGATADPANLQPQLWSEAYRNDRVEVHAMRRICAGKVNLDEARHDLFTDWQSAY
jgi:hypothetical protein